MSLNTAHLVNIHNSKVKSRAKTSCELELVLKRNKKSQRQSKANQQSNSEAFPTYIPCHFCETYLQIYVRHVLHTLLYSKHVVMPLS